MSITISKDEARIFAGAIEAAKYNFANNLGHHTKEECIRRINALEKLSAKMEKAGKDSRRTGRRSQDDFTDCVKRIVTKYSHQSNT